MAANQNAMGFDQNFLASERGNNAVLLPQLPGALMPDLLTTVGEPDGVLHYLNYSLQMSLARKFAFFSASNIDGGCFKKADRKDSWRKDARAGEVQFGMELYSAPHANFDRGHLTKREDVQWGATLQEAAQGADSTFFFTNAVPQHKSLNRAVWRSLEHYILHMETTSRKLRVSVLTGPVLRAADPYFITKVAGHAIQLPVYFWKVVYFLKAEKLARVGFLMSQESLLTKDGITEELESSLADDKLFLAFKKAATYQVNVDLIEKMTNLKMSPAMDVYQDNRLIELVLSEINVDSDLEIDRPAGALSYIIQNLIV